MELLRLFAWLRTDVVGIAPAHRGRHANGARGGGGKRRAGGREVGQLVSGPVAAPGEGAIQCVLQVPVQARRQRKAAAREKKEGGERGSKKSFYDRSTEK